MTTCVALLLAMLLVGSAGCGGGDPARAWEWERMLTQPRFDAFAENPLFDDGAAMRHPSPGTVVASLGSDHASASFFAYDLAVAEWTAAEARRREQRAEVGARRSQTDTQESGNEEQKASGASKKNEHAASGHRYPGSTKPFAKLSPRERGLVRLRIGRNLYDQTCAACHGKDGFAETPVAENMTLRRPPSLHKHEIREMSLDEMYRVATDGYGLMPPYSDLLTKDERWAVALYVKALQLSRDTTLEKLPQEVRTRATRKLAATSTEPPS